MSWGYGNDPEVDELDSRPITADNGDERPAFNAWDPSSQQNSSEWGRDFLAFLDENNISERELYDQRRQSDAGTKKAKREPHGFWSGLWSGLST